MALVHPTPVGPDGSAGVNELFGLALVEAMACGCPVIASAVASLPEIVDDGRTGFLVPPGDPAAIGSAIERLRCDAELWRAASVAGRERVEAHFSWSAVASRCLRIYAGDEEETAA
jgi:glycosyltransferase involved in cell wall biosynthesis